MSKVPAGYSPEPGAARCGDSYADRLIVDGKLPGKGLYGTDLQRELPGRPLPQISYGANSPQEQELDADLRAEIGDIRERMDLESFLFTPKRMQSIDWLLEAAEQHLDQIEDIYRPALPGSTPAEQQMRGATVRRLFADASRHVRCAEYKTYRTILYAQARERYEDEQKRTGGSGQAVGGFLGKPIEPIELPPQEPPDDQVIDPANLPSFPTWPDAAPGPEGGSPEPSATKTGKGKLFLAALGLTALVVAPKVLK